MSKKDKRIVYGMRCTWWDSIDKVSTIQSALPGLPGGKATVGIPCCPHCRNVLYELPAIENWQRGVDAHDAKHPGYAAMMEWARGKCFPNMDALKAAFEAGRH